ncbi:MAG: hypothetical protein U9Q71_07905 [Pseudomonadota bacterium]|nr:hypothetical protein [Pseudomonadota bacterium]
MARYWKAGGKWDVWANQVATVERFVRDNKLEPLDRESRAPYVIQHGAVALPNVAINSSTVRAAQERVSIEDVWEKFVGIRGGMIVPHLHFRGDIYMLNDEQWKAFSGEMLGTIRAKLEKVNAVSFDDLMELSDAISATPITLP